MTNLPRSAIARWAWLGCWVPLLLTVSGCGEPPSFHCQTDDQCVSNSAVGHCEGDGYCSFPDDSCTSQRRYGKYAPADRRDSCVPLCISDLALGDQHGCLLRDPGVVMCWGDSANEKLGAGQAGKQRVPPTALPALRDARALGAGSQHTCAITGEEGRIGCWGDNSGGQLGDNGKIAQADPVVVKFGGATNLQAVEVAGGLQHTCAQSNKSSGSLVCWGTNNDCQLGDCSAPSGLAVAVAVPPEYGNIRALAAGGNSSCARLDDGLAFCWGESIIKTTQCAGPTINNTIAQMLPVDAVSAIGLSSATNSTGPLLSSQTTCTGAGSALRCCGGQVLSNTLPAVITTIAVGHDHLCLLVEQRVHCLGDNAVGQLGQGHTNAANGLVEVMGLPPISKLVVSKNTSCVLTDMGALYCWGGNDQGQANPYDEADAVPTPSDALISKVSCFMDP